MSEYLSTADERQQWHDHALPVDELCTENAIMLKRYNRYPLIIDPSGRITDFLQNSQQLIASYAASAGAGVGRFVAGLAVALFALFFLLYEGRSIWAFVLRFVPRAARDRTDHAARTGWASLIAYVRATVIVALVDAVGVLIAALILGVPLAPALAALVSGVESADAAALSDLAAAGDPGAGEEALVGVAANAESLGLTDVSARYVDQVGAVATDGSWSAVAQLGWRVAGDAVPSQADVVVRFAPAGDDAALGALYDRWHPVVHGVASRLLRQPNDVEDVVEQTFWQAWRQASRFDRSRGAVQTWLSTIARSRARSRDTTASSALGKTSAPIS